MDQTSPRLNASRAEAASGQFDQFRYQVDYVAALESVWNPAPPEIPIASEHRSFEDEGDVLFSIDTSPPTPWTVAFTPTFRKSIAGVDKNLQGRVLLALAELSESPTTAHGDTVKPLRRELKGLWRYRLGTYRLVYEPKQKERVVMLLEFTARGDVYE